MSPAKMRITMAIQRLCITKPTLTVGQVITNALNSYHRDGVEYTPSRDLMDVYDETLATALEKYEATPHP